VAGRGLQLQAQSDNGLRVFKRSKKVKFGATFSRSLHSHYVYPQLVFCDLMNEAITHSLSHVAYFLAGSIDVNTNNIIYTYGEDSI